MRIFQGVLFRSRFRIQRLLARQWIHDDVSLRVFVRAWQVDIVSPAPCTWHLLVPSRRPKSTIRGFSGRFFQKCSPILRCLARQRIHVCVSVRVCGRLCLATETGTHSANCAGSSFMDVGGCAILGSTVDTCTASVCEETVVIPQLQPICWTWSFKRPLCVTTDAHGRCPHAVHRRWWTSLWCRSDKFQLFVMTAGMWGRFLRALHIGAGPGVVSTGTRPP